jgi:hypothetical protein
MEITIDMKEITRFMRMGGRAPDTALAVRIEALRDEALGMVRPARVWRRFPIENGVIATGECRLDVVGELARHLDGCREVYLVCGTIGALFDAFQRRVSVRSGADALIAQAIGAALIEKWMDMTGDAILAEMAPGESLRRRYSPGYGDFPLEAQRDLLAMLDASRKVGVSLTDTLLMVPSKSVSAVLGIDRK